VIAVISVFIFLGILWEAFASHRAVIRRKAVTRALDMAHRYPPLNHSYASCPVLISLFDKLTKLKNS